ncbi:hypothetical protein BDW74DRAFT_179336 [Aspergillus multicolor]|uniref:uncharacterized protein n=1 Tax=Aspergillus multicolor TaxID=41759 RepID=UPI003CCD32D8
MSNNYTEHQAPPMIAAFTFLGILPSFRPSNIRKSLCRQRLSPVKGHYLQGALQ